MPLSGPELKKLSDVLKNAYALEAFDQLLFYRLNKTRQDISLAGNFKDIRFEVLQLAERENWTRALVLHAYQENPQNSELKAFFRRLTQRAQHQASPDWYTPVDHYQTCFISEDDLFVDRREIRQLVENIVNGNGSHTIGVDGPSKSGKSYICDYIQYLRHQEGGFQLVAIDFLDWPKLKCSFSKVAKAILKKIEKEGVDCNKLLDQIATEIDIRDGEDYNSLLQAMADPQPGTDAKALNPRQAEKMAEILTTLVTKAGGKWIFVIDGLKQTPLPEGTPDLIQNLLAAAGSDDAPELHIFLLGTKSEYSVEKDCELNCVEHLELEMFYEHIFKGRGDQFTRDGVDFLVDETVNKIPGGLLEDIKIVVAAVEETITELFPA